METNTTVSAKPARSEHVLVREDLEKLTMKQLHSANDALSLAADVLLGITQQPRFGVDDQHILNAAGELINGLLEHIYCCRNLLHEVAEAAAPDGVDESEMRAWVLLARAVDYHDGLPDVAALAAGLAAHHASVEFHARHRRAS